MTNAQIYQLLHSDGELWRSAEVGYLIAAVGIKYESASTPNHAARLEWANAIFADTPGFVKANKVKLLENPTILAAGHAATDNDVNFVCASHAPAAV